jgi:ribose 5-phosphate isomerase B
LPVTRSRSRLRLCWKRDDGRRIRLLRKDLNMTKLLGVASDHAGLTLKRDLVAELDRRGIAVRVFGTNTATRVTTPTSRTPWRAQSRAATSSALSWSAGLAWACPSRPIGHAAVRAVVCSEPLSARMSRQHNDANVLCIGARVWATARRSISWRRSWTPLSRAAAHAARVAKINPA